jgi:CheY-like chemotaxis protein/DNA-binding XRE family transcriptional regulator
MTGSDVKKAFGAAVRQHRHRLGLSQEALAERAALHRTYVTDVERGARNLSLESISKLARALQVTIGALFQPPALPTGAGARPGRAEAHHHGVDLLLVEDDPLDVELTLRAFAQAKLANSVEVVRDGAEALDYLFCRGNYAQRRPSAMPPVVLLDLYLPKVHGLEVLRQLRNGDGLRNVQVIVLTGSRNDAHVREALSLGANAYLVKPVDFRNFSTVAAQLDFQWKLLMPESQDT